VSDCCLTPNEQYEELDISKNFGRPYTNTNFDKEYILANHKSYFKVSILFILLSWVGGAMFFEAIHIIVYPYATHVI
jgi:hypothetical protein